MVSVQLMKHPQKMDWQMNGKHSNRKSKNILKPGNNAHKFCMYYQFIFKMFFNISFLWIRSCDLKKLSYVMSLFIQYVETVEKNPNFEEFLQDLKDITRRCANVAWTLTELWNENADNKNAICHHSTLNWTKTWEIYNNIVSIWG